MNVTLGARMGGPDAAAKFHAVVVKLRPIVKATLSEIMLDAVAELDFELYIGGAVTDYCPEAFEATIRYTKKGEVLWVKICVPQKDMESVGEASAEETIFGWLIRGLELSAFPKSVANLDLKLVVGALNAATK
ncbi:Imm12 family immunity protein [Stenotrophomonas terrae]|uniref:Imm12 family immunity protein n=1 Tax=Stenotrophomonas terrae TaxID=405446 RepID=UPI00320BB2AC